VPRLAAELVLSHRRPGGGAVPLSEEELEIGRELAAAIEEVHR